MIGSILDLKKMKIKLKAQDTHISDLTKTQVSYIFQSEAIY